MSDDKNIHRNHRSRVRKEFMEKGLEHFPAHKVLEFLLYYNFSQGDTNPLAHRLINRFGSFSNVFNAPYHSLVEVDGVGEKAAIYIKLLGAFAKYYLVDSFSSQKRIRSSEDAKQYVQYRFVGEAAEQLLLVCLDSSGTIIYSDVMATGTSSQVQVLPVDIVKQCLRVDAVQAVLAHNHPNGSCTPSKEDVNTTLFLYSELARLNIELMDHIIVASDGIYSMQEHNLFAAKRIPQW